MNAAQFNLLLEAESESILKRIKDLPPIPKGKFRCAYCKKAAEFRCDRCKWAHYCSRECQEKDWKAGHRWVCGPDAMAKLSKEIVDIVKGLPSEPAEKEPRENVLPELDALEAEEEKLVKQAATCGSPRDPKKSAEEGGGGEEKRTLVPRRGERRRELQKRAEKQRYVASLNEDTIYNLNIQLTKVTYGIEHVMEEIQVLNLTDEQISELIAFADPALVESMNTIEQAVVDAGESLELSEEEKEKDVEMVPEKKKEPSTEQTTFSRILSALTRAYEKLQTAVAATVALLKRVWGAAADGLQGLLSYVGSIFSTLGTSFLSAMRLAKDSLLVLWRYGVAGLRSVFKALCGQFSSILSAISGPIASCIGNLFSGTLQYASDALKTGVKYGGPLMDTFVRYGLGGAFFVAHLATKIPTLMLGPDAGEKANRAAMMGALGAVKDYLVNFCATAGSYASVPFEFLADKARHSETIQFVERAFDYPWIRKSMEVAGYTGSKLWFVLKKVAMFVGSLCYRVIAGFINQLCALINIARELLTTALGGEGYRKLNREQFAMGALGQLHEYLEKLADDGKVAPLILQDLRDWVDAYRTTRTQMIKTAKDREGGTEFGRVVKAMWASSMATSELIVLMYNRMLALVINNEARIKYSVEQLAAQSKVAEVEGVTFSPGEQRYLDLYLDSMIAAVRDTLGSYLGPDLLPPAEKILNNIPGKIADAAVGMPIDAKERLDEMTKKKMAEEPAFVLTPPQVLAPTPVITPAPGPAPAAAPTPTAAQSWTWEFLKNHSLGITAAVASTMTAIACLFLCVLPAMRDIGEKTHNVLQNTLRGEEARSANALAAAAEIPIDAKNADTVRQCIVDMEGARTSVEFDKLNEKLGGLVGRPGLTAAADVFTKFPNRQALESIREAANFTLDPKMMDAAATWYRYMRLARPTAAEGIPFLSEFPGTSSFFKLWKSFFGKNMETERLDVISSYGEAARGLSDKYTEAERVVIEEIDPARAVRETFFSKETSALFTVGSVVVTSLGASFGVGLFAYGLGSAISGNVKRACFTMLAALMAFAIPVAGVIFMNMAFSLASILKTGLTTATYMFSAGAIFSVLPFFFSSLATAVPAVISAAGTAAATVAPLILL